MKNADLLSALSLYGVTDRAWLPRPFPEEDLCGALLLASAAEDCIRGGTTMIQLREKDIPRGDMLRIGKAVGNVCRKYNVPFIVDDDVDAALLLKADGVHVGQSDTDAAEVRRRIGQDMILGVSVQSVGQAVRAQAADADYLGAGAVFPTQTKSDAGSVSRECLADICAAVTIPVVAIGGIHGGNIARLNGTGIAGAAVVSALFASRDKTEAARALAPACRAFTASCTAVQRAEREHGKRAAVMQSMRAAVFDMDGTLLDSMPMWEHAAELYLRSKHIEPEPDIWNRTKSLDMRQTAGYFKRAYGMTGSVELIIEEIDDVIYGEYAHTLRLKDGARGFLEALVSRGIPMVLATSTDRRCAEVCLKRLGIAGCFRKLLTCSEAGAGKDKPDIYLEAQRCTGTDAAHTVVFEDALYAGRTAAQAGFPVCAVYDESTADNGDWLRLQLAAACSCFSFRELSV
ncbi:MAG TPA: thiamine phosphate synthase [Treponema sp.]|nr:thiamine phosphate synthase [Treponema sp.]